MVPSPAVPASGMRPSGTSDVGPDTSPHGTVESSERTSTVPSRIPAGTKTIGPTSSPASPASRPTALRAADAGVTRPQAHVEFAGTSIAKRPAASLVVFTWTARPGRAATSAPRRRCRRHRSRSHAGSRCGRRTLGCRRARGSAPSTAAARSPAAPTPRAARCGRRSADAHEAGRVRGCRGRRARPTSVESPHASSTRTKTPPSVRKRGPVRPCGHRTRRPPGLACRYPGCVSPRRIGVGPRNQTRGACSAARRRRPTKTSTPQPIRYGTSGSSRWRITKRR